MITIGVLSGTHLLEADGWLQQVADTCFGGADMILHAGDLTSLSVLEAFGGKTVHAVHGNMCGPKTRSTLPASRIIEVPPFRIALIHGAGYRHNIEDKLFDLFAPVDCIVYGHTHRAVCHSYGPTLMLNPGSLTATGTYGIITVDGSRLKGKIHYLGTAP